MKIAIAQQNYILGNFEYNLNKIKEAVLKAKKSQADIVLLSELSISGYPPTDFFYFNDFVEQCQNAVGELLPLSKDIAIVVGAPSFNSKLEGKDLFNSAYFIYNQQVQQIVHKTLLPNYDIFDEYRYFEPNTVFECVQFKGKKIALTICEDIWNIGEQNPMYLMSPMEELSKQKPDFMLNLSASPFSAAHADERKEIVARNAQTYQIPVFYCNTVGAHTEILFDGGSLVSNKKGDTVLEMKYFEEDFNVVSLEDVESMSKSIAIEQSLTKRKYNALILGIKDYFNKMGFKKAILGLSGGIDSALTCVLAVEALGPENVLSVLLPSEFSSSHSVEDAIALCHNLNSPYHVVEIKDTYAILNQTLHAVFDGKPFDLTEENMQARIRGTILMAISNKFGHILLNTSNKSEMAVGYGTLYGDMCGGLSVIGDLYKTEVYEMCRYINRKEEIIPIHTITKAPSAELRPNQKDQDSLPPYEELDAILKEYIEEQKGPKEIVENGYDNILVKNILQMVNRNEFKRKQAAPIIRISNKSFGSGRRIPIVAKYL